MVELRVAVREVRGHCTACPAVKPGDYFEVRDDLLFIPEEGYVCIWALQSLLPIIAAKAFGWETEDRLFQCPDPKGKVLFEIVGEGEEGQAPDFVVSPPEEEPEEPLQDLQVTVERVRGKCASGMARGDRFLLRSGRITIPEGKGFCRFALQAVLPLLPAKQRPLVEGDWLKDDSLVICPDPAGNVIMRIEALE